MYVSLLVVIVYIPIINFIYIPIIIMFHPGGGVPVRMGPLIVAKRDMF